MTTINTISRRNGIARFLAFHGEDFANFIFRQFMVNVPVASWDRSVVYSICAIPLWRGPIDMMPINAQTITAFVGGVIGALGGRPMHLLTERPRDQAGLAPDRHGWALFESAPPERPVGDTPLLDRPLHQLGIVRAYSSLTLLAGRFAGVTVSAVSLIMGNAKRACFHVLRPVATSNGANKVVLCHVNVLANNVGPV